jgi:di/tricarboxylate transporter
MMVEKNNLCIFPPDFNSIAFFRIFMIPDHLQPYVVLLVVAGLFFLIYRDLLRPSLAFLLSVMLFAILGILNSEEILSGFSNPSIASILLLILITGGLRKNFNLELLFDWIFRSANGYRRFLLRMMAQVAVLSSFINNTPVVALMTPYVFDWGRKHNISPSRLLIPLSFATIMGGMITLIGTSTTLVLNGFLIDFDLPPLLATDLLVIGGSITVSGIIFITFMGHRLLPNYKDILESFRQNRREYLVETTLSQSSRLSNKSVLDAGLRNLKGVYLVEIIRKNKVISPVKPSEVIREEDVMIFAGNTEEIMDLVKPGKGLSLPFQSKVSMNGQVEVVEAVVSNNSQLINKKVKDSDFRNKYDAAIVAVHRNGEKLRGKIGEIRLSPGDLLLLYSGPDFKQRIELYGDLYAVSILRQFMRPSPRKIYALITSILAALFFLFTGALTLFPSLLIIFSILAAFKMISIHDVKREIDLDLIAILVFSLAIGQAIIKTGTGDLIANAFLNILQPYGYLAVLSGLLILTTLLTSFISNVGAISIAFPLAFAVSKNLGGDGMPLYLAITYAASAAFLTPVGYQTNLIIFGPGGYKFKDFVKIGFPVTMIYLIVTLTCIYFLYQGSFV